jgi:hypothetical protein
LIPFSAAASPPDMSVVARPPFFPISWYPSLPNCPARAWPPRLRPAPKCSIIRMHMMSKISRSILCILHKRRCARFPDPYAYFTNYFTSFYTKENFTWLSRNPKKKVSASCYCCCCTFSCAGVIFIPSARCSWASKLLPPVPPSTTVSPERALASSSFRSAADDILAL